MIQMHRLAFVILLVATLLPAAPSRAGEGPGGMDVVIARSTDNGEVTASGRIVARNRVGILPQVGGRIMHFGTSSDGQTLDIGMKVEEGQTLFSVDPAPYELRVRAAEAALGSARASLADLIAPPRKERLTVLRAAVTEQAARLENQRREVGRYGRLDAARVTAKAQFENVQLEEARIRAQLDTAQAALDEALSGPTPTVIAMTEARVKEAEVALDAARKDLLDVETKAPFAGTIVDRAKGVGDMTSSAPGGEVLTLVSAADLEAELTLPESYFTRIVPGETGVILRGPTLDADLPLVVSRVVPDIDPRLGTFTLRITIPAGKRGRLAAGSFVTASLQPADKAGAVILPLSAVARDADGDFVYVADGSDVKRRAVQVGDRLTEGIVISRGVKAGERVILGANDAHRNPVTRKTL